MAEEAPDEAIEPAPPYDEAGDERAASREVARILASFIPWP